MVSFRLSQREEEVMALLIQGQTRRQIAYTLGISPHTVKVYVSRIYGKLGVNCVTKAVVVYLLATGSEKLDSSPPNVHQCTDLINAER